MFDWSKKGSSPSEAASETEPEPQPVQRAHVGGKLTLTAEQLGKVSSARTPYAPYPSTPLTRDNLAARRAAAQKVAEDAGHLAEILGEVEAELLAEEATLAAQLAKEQTSPSAPEQEAEPE